ncbi:MAG: hypothetical protein SGBAC_003673 [Bacillariaceae sp.]
MSAAYHPQPHDDDTEHSVSSLPEDQQQLEQSPKPRISPRAQRRISPWAMDLQLKRGNNANNAAAASSRTQRSTSSWKMRMQQRKAVFGEVAVAEDEEEEEEEDGGGILEQPALDHDDGPTPQQKAMQYVQEQRREKERKESEQQQKSQPQEISESQKNEASTGLGTLMEDDDEEEEEEEEEEEISPEIIKPAVMEAATEEVNEDEGLSEIEIQRKLVIKELKEVLGKMYRMEEHIVESISMRDPTDEELNKKFKKKIETAEEGQKQIVMKDLAKRVSGIYTNDHHVVEAITPDRRTKEAVQVGADIAQAATLATAALTEALEEDDTGNDEPVIIGQTDTAEVPKLSLQEQQAKTMDLPMTTLKPSVTKDLPRANFSFPSIARSTSQDSDDDISVFTEVTIEEIVQSVAPESSEAASDDAFKDQMRKSFVAFEQLVHAKHQIDNDDYDEETVFEEYSIVHDDSKTVMTEFTTDELIEQVVASSRNTNDNTVVGTTAPSEAASQDPLENFQTEMRKSFAAFESLIGDDEFDEPENDGDSCEESFDEFTIMESTVANSQQQDDGKSYDEVTIAESIVAELAGVVQAENRPSTQTTDQADKSKEKRKEEKIKQFQNEMRNSFTAFESLLLKQSEKEEEDDADSGASDEYTIEEIVDQVTAGDDSKLFAKEMQKSFLAFESLLKQGDDVPNSKEDESVWDEETVQETVQGSAVEPPMTPQIASYNTPSAAAATPLSPNRSVASSRASEQSGKTYEDAISLVGGEGAKSASGTNCDNAIMVLDADEEKSRMQTDQSQSHKSYEESGEEEKKDGDSLLQNTQQFLNAIGGMVSFDKGDNTQDTEQETLSGHMRPDNMEKKEDVKASSGPQTSLPSSPKKKSEGPKLILTKPEPKTPSPTKKSTRQQDLQLDISLLTNSRMFSENGLVLPSAEKKSKVKTPHKSIPVMDVEFNHGTYDDDDDNMTQITFDHTVHDTPHKQRPPPKEDEESPGNDETGSTCSSQASRGIADILRKDIWSPDMKVVQIALEKLGLEAVKGRSFRSHIVKFGGLLGILRAMDMNPTHSGIQLAACQALERLALDPETQLAIGGVGGIPVVGTSMQNNSGNVEIQRAGTAALVNISCCPQDNIEGVLESVILSMTKHSHDTEVQENSFKVLANLTMDSPDRLKELSSRGGLAAMTMALQKPWSIKAEHHEAISLLSMLLRNLAECNQ